MRPTNMENAISKTRLLVLMTAVMMLVTATAFAAAPGITGPTFNLTAQAAYISQPDGQAIYSWGYGCNGAPTGFDPPTITTAFCNSMQVPGPTLVVTEGQTVTVNLLNGLPAAAGNTSILFPGFNVTSTGGAAGLLAQEATPGSTVTYTFTASSPGTRAYYSGTQGDLQVEMGMYGVIIVLPATIPSACTSGLRAANSAVEAIWHESDYRLQNATGGVGAAYDHPDSCYDREYLFQFSEIDPNIHHQAEQQVATITNCTPANHPSGPCPTALEVPTEPYHPTYFMINGRSMPDNMDPNYATQYPHQPYNGDPHMHVGELSLIRVVGTGRWQHPFHEHANHVRILARDGNMILSSTSISYPAGANTVSAPALAGPALFTTSTVPGQTADGIFYFTGRGLNWDMYAHNPSSKDPNATLPCNPDAYGYNTGYAASDINYSGTPAPDTSVRSRINYFEWCQDHNKPLEVAPFGDVANGGPATLPDPNLLTNGAWFSGSPYLGPDATARATYGTCTGTGTTTSCSTTGTTPPSGTIANPPSSEAGFAYMWHSHNEREITTNNIFPGGMLMMLLVDSREFVIDETN